MRRFLLPLLFLYPLALLAQIGGQEVYTFLRLPASARISAMGGNLITVVDDDVNLAAANPALLNELMHEQLSFNHSFHLDGIGHGQAAYGHYVPAWKTTLHGAVQYISYGDFQRTDEFFRNLGSFNASEYAVTVGAARRFYERISLGVNLQFITSQFDVYNSTGIGADVGITYQDTARSLTFNVVFQNMGTQLSSYTENNRETFPFDLQIGIAKRLQYLPFRFSIIYENLQQWNVLYDDPNATEDQFIIGEFGEGSGEDNNDWLDNFARHFVFNGELLIGSQENFRLRFGYRHRLRSELQVSNFGSLAGFTFGVGLKINRFRIDYGRYNMHLAGGLNHFTISTNLKEFR